MKNFIKSILPYGVVTKLQRETIITEPEPIELYNSEREKVNVFYLQDALCCNQPYSFVSGRKPRTILWDRNNYALPIHFYTHSEFFKQSKYGEKHFLFLQESEQICPNDYKKILCESELVNNLEALFTHSEKLLNKYPNAKIIPGGGVWYGTKTHGGHMDSFAYTKKNKMLSIVSSNKTQCRLHQFRLDLAKEMLRKDIGDVMGTVVNKYVNIADSLTDYKYSIAIENCSARFYYTEKIMNCFASMTVPIYYGAHDIGKFFNLDGIIIIEKPTIECAIKAIKNCSSDDYNSRKDAIIDNYNRVQKYLCQEDYLMEHYSSIIL